MGWILFFFFVGAALLFVECFMPGLVCGVLGVGFLITSTWLAIRDHPEWTVPIILLEVVGALVTIMIGFYVLPKTRFGRRMVLDTAQKADRGWVSDVTDESLRGATAEVITALRPAGTIVLDGKRISAVSTGEFIDAGVRVRVVETHGNRVVVEPATSNKEREAQ